MGFVFLVSTILITSASSQQDPTTPTPFHPKSQYVAVKYDPQDSSNSINDKDFSNESEQAEDNVVYVAPDDYDLDLEKSDKPMSDQASSLDPDTKVSGEERYSAFEGIGSASELYRLLALGPQQSDPGVGGLGRFSGLFGHIPPKANTDLDNIDHCPERPEIGIQYYCMQLEDGIYYDPWNPWCGFIRCSDGVAERVCCKQGTWLGMTNLLKANQKDMCRRPLNTLKMTGDRCPLPNTSDLCRAAKKVEKMNPPKKKIERPIAQFSRLNVAKSALPEPVEDNEPFVSASVTGDKTATDDTGKDAENSE